MSMDRAEIRERLINLLRSAEFIDENDVSRLHDDTSLVNEIGLTSLQLLEFIAGIERAFGFRANSDRLRIDTFDRFDRVIDFVHGALVSQTVER